MIITKIKTLMWKLHEFINLFSYLLKISLTFPWLKKSFYMITDSVMKDLSSVPWALQKMWNMYVYQLDTNLASSIKPFVTNAPFLFLLTVLWCFQDVEKRCIGNEWVKQIYAKFGDDPLDIKLTFQVYIHRRCYIITRKQNPKFIMSAVNSPGKLII